MIDIETIKAHAVIDHDRDDILLENYLAAAIAHVQQRTGLLLQQQNVTARFDSFQDLVDIKTPLISVQSITYQDTEGSTRTLSTDVYGVSPYAALVKGQYFESGTVFLKQDQRWPETLDQKDVIEVIYSAGFSSIPYNLRLAIMIMVADMYENRESLAPVRLNEIPNSASAFMQPFIRETM